MRILVAIPHYFAARSNPQYGSEGGDAPERARVARLCLASLRQTFSSAQGLLDGRQRAVHSANSLWSATMTIALCTTGDSHLVPHLADCGFDHVTTRAEPRFLGFECHKVLQSGLGKYDYFAYLEDDLRLADPLFLAKLAWFNARFGDAAVLQPNRFETIAEPGPYKLYIDGNMHDGAAPAAPQRLDEEPRLEAPAFGHRLVFRRVANPHSGAFFLTAAQLARWAAAPDFAVPSADFGGPLESAATLGLVRHFRVYKPARENAGFLEIEHLAPRYLGRRVEPIPGEPPRLRML